MGREDKENAKEAKISKKPTRNKRPFFKFQKNKFTKLAREYHHELIHLTIDLRRINQKIQESAALCSQQIAMMRRKNCGHLVSRTGFIHFEDSLYHLENFIFRVTGYRDKMIQFINQALRIGFDERSMGVLRTMISHGTVRDAHLDTEIKKFDKDKDLKDILSERVLMAHRRYYSEETGYNNFMFPISESPKDTKHALNLWKQNISTKVNRANRVTLRIFDMNDKIMEKINSYLEKHPVR